MPVEALGQITRLIAVCLRDFTTEQATIEIAARLHVISLGGQTRDRQ